MSDALDQAMSRVFPRGNPIRFIQIGGNDGVYQDPLYQHHLRADLDFEWGQVYEPIPEYFQKLVRNMSRFDYVTCHQAAVDSASTPGRRQFSYVSADDVECADLPPSSMGIGSFSLSAEERGDCPYPEAKYNAVRKYIRTIEVDTVPISDVVGEYGSANVLVTDCEGHDLSLIRPAIFDHGFRPTILQFEHARTGEAILRDTLQGLKDLGYAITASGKDYVAELL